MKNPYLIMFIFFLYGCSNSTSTSQINDVQGAQLCIGDTLLPSKLQGKFKGIEDNPLLASSLGKPNEGKLCQGQVYQSKTEVALYRAWNSTNPGSQMGHWWAFEQPSGKVSKYRSDYEICYQWSPLDKLTRCTLKQGIKIVVGTGQSAKCSEYLTYPISATQQIYINNATISVTNCETFDDKFHWQ